MINGINTIRVTIMAIKELIKEVWNIRNAIIKAATAKATPTP
jgi:hypothetical protein